MSTLRVYNIENPTTAAGGIGIATDGSVTVGGLQYPTAGPLSNRNLIINGAIDLDQRNDGSPVGTNGSFVCDRFEVVHASNGVFSAQQVVEAPDNFKTSLKVTATTADTDLTTGQQLCIRQLIEGFNTIPTNFGKASTRTLSLSFWVRSSLTGTFGGAIGNSADDRSYVFSYTVNSANTWEYKTVTIPGDTTGTWLIDNGIGIRVTWSLGTGPDLSETAGSWYGSVRRGVTGGVNLLGTLNATWQITGVQLEVGSKATPFEHRSYGQELALCQRYYQTLSRIRAWPRYSNSSLDRIALVPLPVKLRATPTVAGTTSGISAGTASFIAAIDTVGLIGDAAGATIDASATDVTIDAEL